MPKFTYHLQLKGYVGGEDFNREDVDDVLAAHPDEEVHVLIDSTGGSLATGMSISASFRQHGNVHVHLVGLNASAATIASLGAKRVTMDSGAMYLIHKCSLDFFKWAALNSDQFRQMIADAERTAEALDKLDENCARLYARKCKRQPEDILALMKIGGWISPKDALDWGFVDEITDFPGEAKACLTDTLASAMAVEGMPIPNIPVINAGSPESIVSRILSAISSFFKPATNAGTSLTQTLMNKTYAFICALIGTQTIAFSDDKATMTAQQLDSIEAALAAKDKDIKDHLDTIAVRDARIAELEAALAKQPAEHSKTVVEEGKKNEASEKSDVEAFVDTYNSARNLYNLV